MGLFNFGNKQRMHTQLYGETNGKEMFQVEEYNKRKKTSGILTLSIILAIIFLYFEATIMPIKILALFIIGILGTGMWLFFNFQQQMMLRDKLYY